MRGVVCVLFASIMFKAAVMDVNADIYLHKPDQEGPSLLTGDALSRGYNEYRESGVRGEEVVTCCHSYLCFHFLHGLHKILETCYRITA